MSSLALNPRVAEFAKSQTNHPHTQEEELHQLISYNPKIALSKSNLRHVMWKVAAFVTMAAFVALAVVAVIFTSISASLHLPIVTLAVLAGGLPLSAKAVTWMWSKGNHHRAHAKFAANLQKRVEKIDDGIMSQNLKKYEVDISKISSQKIRATPSLLKPAIARLNRLLEKCNVFQKGKFSIKTKEQTREGIDTLNEKIAFLEKKTKDTNYSVNDYDQLQHLRLQKYQLEEKKISSRIKQALIVHLLQNPKDFKQSFAGEPLHKPWIERMVAKASNDPHADAYLRIGGEKPKIFTREMILNQNLVTLSKELYKA